MSDALTIPSVLTDDDRSRAVSLLRGYFDSSTPGSQFTGAFFERLDGGGDRPEVRDRITGADVVAVSMLSVDIPSAAARALRENSDEISRLLRDIPGDLDLVDADEALIGKGSAARALWDLLDSVHGIGWVTTNKLLARKRPRLLPVYDHVVRDVVGRPKHLWLALQTALARDDRALHQRLLAIRDDAEVGEDISPLRVFDVVCWRYATRQGID